MHRLAGRKTLPALASPPMKQGEDAERDVRYCRVTYTYEVGGLPKGLHAMCPKMDATFEEPSCRRWEARSVSRCMWAKNCVYPPRPRLQGSRENVLAFGFMK